LFIFNCTEWLVELEDKGITLSGDIVKYRKRIVFDESRAGFQNFNANLFSKQTNEELFFFDNKGVSANGSKENDDDNMDMMDGAFVTASRSMKTSDNGSRKRKELGGADESGTLFKSLKYKINRSANDNLSSGSEGVSSGSEVENPSSDDEMDDTD
jgi:hypothetical protein